MDGGHIAGRAVVTFDAPHGTDSVVLHDNSISTFGRDGSCEIRFGHAPTVDRGIPRVAGRFIVTAGRVVVECADGPHRRSMQVVAVGSPPVLVGLGEAFSPSSTTFRVVVHGELSARSMTVYARMPGMEPTPTVDDTPTSGFTLGLTPRQREVLEQYLQPLLRGRLEPATHREVATALGCHVNSARSTLYEIWGRMFEAGIPMPDMADKRVAVTEAARLHRLLGHDRG